MADEPGKRNVSWLRRVGLAGLIVIVSVLVAHQIWGASSQRNYWKRISALENACEPTKAKDFQSRDAGSAENAAGDLIAAIGVFIDISPALSQSFDRQRVGLPLRADERRIITDMQPHWLPDFKLVDRAITKSKLEWDFDARPLQPFGNESGQSLHLAEALAVNALWEHDRGQDQNVGRYFDGVHLISRHSGMYPSILAHIISLDSADRIVRRLAEMAPDLKIDPADPSSISPKEVRRLIDALRDDNSTNESLILAIKGERVTGSELLRAMADGTTMGTGWGNIQSLPAPNRFVLKPILYQNGSVALDHITKLLAPARSPNWPAMKASMPPPIPRSISNTYLRMAVPAGGNTMEIHFRALTDRRLASLALALRWYSSEHNGQLPQTLEELVPQYLASVPIDPMSGTGDPIRYISKSGSPVLYSVGSNGLDDKGAETDNRVSGNAADWQMPDAVLHLVRRPRPLPNLDDDGP